MHAPRKTEDARKMLAAASERRLAPALRALLITVDGKRSRAELVQLARNLGLGGAALDELTRLGLIECPDPDAAQLQAQRSRRLVAAKFFALDLVTRMTAGREGSLREAAREANTESRFMLWLEQCCTHIAEQSDAERAAMFRARVQATLDAPQ
ncbi:hypothetical protein LZ017_14740 [Pelomonas sp. CA6]|uniref:hypothetical protein n=1 Tax=Pelomonas sp. CA6 TaxID=2907999 RepID=UPI001F4C02A6|nr:hypothetical protein [Pelomonas sp. CA6]MCH7344636.1 hypothetical protein [Pelomonas sp. CA6]